MTMSEQLKDHELASKEAFFTDPITKRPHPVSLNSTGIHPVEFKCLILLESAERVTKGGIHIPDTRHERDQQAETYATLIEVGGNCFEDWKGTIPKSGDRIIIDKYSGEVLRAGELMERYRLCNDKDIVAVISE